MRMEGGGVWGSGPQTDKHLPQSPFIGQFFRGRHFALPSVSFIFLRKAVLFAVSILQGGGGGGVGWED